MKTLELLEDMESPNTPGKTWRKGQLVYDLADDYAQTLIDSGKAKVWMPPPPPPPPPPKPRKLKPNVG